MVTRFYFHAANSTIGGTLPSAEQSAKTAIVNYEAQTVNRSMDLTIGAGQTTLSATRAVSDSSNILYYVTKFISPALNQTSVAANTWTYNFSCKISATANIDDYPVNDVAKKVPICAYVWRPSTNTKVGNIFDTDSTSVYIDTGNQSTNPSGGTANQIAQHGTFSGSLVSSVVAGDVIVFEAWIYVWHFQTTSSTLSYMFDGTTVNTTAAATVSNHASFLETPETLAFVPTTIPQTIMIEWEES